MKLLVVFVLCMMLKNLRLRVGLDLRWKYYVKLFPTKELASDWLSRKVSQSEASFLAGNSLTSYFHLKSKPTMPLNSKNWYAYIFTWFTKSTFFFFQSNSYLDVIFNLNSFILKFSLSYTHSAIEFEKKCTEKFVHN